MVYEVALFVKTNEDIMLYDSAVLVSISLQATTKEVHCTFCSNGLDESSDEIDFKKNMTL